MSRCAWIGALIAALVSAHASAAPARLVFGSFTSQTNAATWAREVAERTALAVNVVPYDGAYRVATEALDGERLVDAIARADEAKVDAWRASEPPILVTVAASADARTSDVLSRETARSSAARAAQAARWSEAQEMDLDVGFQTRSYAHTGYDGQSKFQPSISLSYHHRATLSTADSITFTPFARYDAEDDERTHADLRELYWSHVGGDWDLHVGVRQVFWGVAEFKHLVDVINQADFVENIDGEDRLGQPMVNLSVVRDWGIVDLFVLPGFRERTFPGEDGRLRFAYPVDQDAEFERGAGKGQVDYAVRWSHQLGPVEWGIYQFAGTGRDPMLVPEVRANGEVMLRPHYDAADQTGLDAQATLGDWALKLEALSRRSFGERFSAATAGFERTFVGAIGRADVGLVVEYMYDERGDDAFDTILERDVALGTRFRLNDVSDSQALFGFIWDTETEEYLVQVEASRRLGDTWALILESRVFAGADDDPFTPATKFKTAPLQRDDYVQLELTRFF